MGPIWNKVRDEPTRYTYGSPVPAWRIPSDYFILAVISTVLCFWPIGIFALWKSREVYRSSSRGDLDGAWQASSSARFLSWTAFVIGLAILIISVVLIIVHHDEIDIDIDV
ncbi:proline-rich transmembrane protein 1-like [Saccoglossus kowalevskii]